MKIVLLIFSCLLSSSVLGETKWDLSKMDEAWEVAWKRFYHPKTHLFYDYISSYEKGKELSHLPTRNEVVHQYPNPCGYGTGMEDCAILAGTMLETLVDRYERTGEKELKKNMSLLLDGFKRLALIPAYPGFVARGVCVEDGKSIYYNSSRDQYTHCVHGLWKYYNSTVADDSGRRLARSILIAIADRMHKNVVPETNYDFLRADGKPCPLGICRMWNVAPHEAARLPMIYAAAWQMTRDSSYYRLYREYIKEAVEQSEQIGDSYSAYVYLQMMYSFELLSTLETDSGLQVRLQKLIQRVGELALNRSKQCLKEIQRLDKSELEMLGPDWRKVEEWQMQNGYNIPRWGKYRSVWHLIRESGESALVVFLAGNPESVSEEKEIFQQIMSIMDYSHMSSCGILFQLAAYWKIY